MCKAEIGIDLYSLYQLLTIFRLILFSIAFASFSFILRRCQSLSWLGALRCRLKIPPFEIYRHQNTQATHRIQEDAKKLSLRGPCSLVRRYFYLGVFAVVYRVLRRRSSNIQTEFVAPSDRKTIEIMLLTPIMANLRLFQKRPAIFEIAPFAQRKQLGFVGDLLLRN